IDINTINSIEAGKVRVSADDKLVKETNSLKALKNKIKQIKGINKR
ncbi:hypothetical protein LCGC14_2175360, partial [marine sediment metagenome]